MASSGSITTGTKEGRSVTLSWSLSSQDIHIIGSGSVLRTAVIFFYISNEGVSLLENAAHLGLPVPEKIKVVLEQLHDRSTKEEN